MPQSRTGLFDDLVPPTSTSFAGGSPPRRGSLGGGVPPTSTSLASGHVALPRHAARPAHGPKGHPSGAKVTSFFDGPGITHGPSTPPRNGGGLAAGLRAVHEARLSADDILVRDAVHRLDQATKHGRALPPNPALANVPQDWFLRLGLGFNQDAFQNGVNDPPHGVDLVKDGNLPYPQALQKVRDRTGLSNFRMTKTPSQVEQAQTHALGASADVGKTVGFKKGQTDAQTPRGLAQKNRLEANTVDPATGERVTPSSRVRQAVNGYAKGGTETLNGLGLPPLVSDLLVGTALHPLDVGADLQTAGDPRESRDHVLGGAANVAGKVALDLAGGQAARAIGKVVKPLVGPAAESVVASLKRASVWDLVAKADGPEAATRALQSHLGLSPERAARLVRAAEASGEPLGWKGRGGPIAGWTRGRTAMESGLNALNAERTRAEAAGLSARQAVRRRIGMNPGPDPYPMWTENGLKAPNRPFEFGKVKDGNDAETDPYGKTIVNENLKENDARVAVARRHEAGHQIGRFRSPDEPMTDAQRSLLNARIAVSQAIYHHPGIHLPEAIEETLAEWYATGSPSKGLRHAFQKDPFSDSGYAYANPVHAGAEALASGAGLAALMASGYHAGTDLGHTLYGDPDLGTAGEFSFEDPREAGRPTTGAHPSRKKAAGLGHLR